VSPRRLPSLALCAGLLLNCQQAQGSGPPARPAAPPPAAPAKGPRVTDPTARDFELPTLPQARVTLTDAYGGKHAVEVEVAATPDARTRGLMWRTSLAEGKGMLFIFPREQPMSFWMKNCFIWLDMIFIGKDLKIVSVQENAEPGTTSSRPSAGVALYVLEVPGGWAQKVGLKPGLKVQLDGIAGIVAEP
jgi:uncharacterized membrane protein (UPF0127 family)